ncbi:MAG: FKBP-type peptidyl-prolyl cis-trans isomerase [Bacteroidales bacterium]|nr:FKBP-type peptidyl-prolyl cis-trans isomerase [Bacteroidales bacterium]
MKKALSTALYIAATLLLAGCAKTVTPGPNEANKRYFDAWMQMNHPGIEPTGLGIYVIDEQEGNGADVTDNGYALVDYKISSLEGNISSYTDEKTAKQLGDYSITNYYGPKFLTTYKTTIQAGVGDALYGMKVGGYRKIIVPSWLMTAKEFASAQEYLDYYDEDDSPSYTSTIYELTVRDFTEDINKWQIDSIVRFFGNDKVTIGGTPADQIFAGMAEADSVKTGFFYKQLAAPQDTTSFKKDTVLYINYTGKLLNGLVFDTNIERVAKDNNLYSSSKTYEPMQINWAEKYEDLTMTSSKSDMIPGFAMTLWQMRAMEKGVGVFYSPYGYGVSGSGSSIPGYAPLIFEIELVAKPEKK